MMIVTALNCICLTFSFATRFVFLFKTTNMKYFNLLVTWQVNDSSYLADKEVEEELH